jgi:hypothetical protein
MYFIFKERRLDITKIYSVKITIFDNYQIGSIRILRRKIFYCLGGKQEYNFFGVSKTVTKPQALKIFMVSFCYVNFDECCLKKNTPE